MIYFVTHDEQIFHEIFEIFVVINQKPYGLWITISDKHHGYSKVQIHQLSSKSGVVPYNSLVMGNGMNHVRVKSMSY